MSDLVGRGGFRVVEAGWATTIQDLGRSGLAHLGVPRAGAVDRRGAALLNRLVGNPADAAMLETLGRLTIEALEPIVVARGTDASRHTLATGTRLRIDPPEGQVWGYLAVRGGIDVPAVLGSRSTDTLAGLGPLPVVDGDTLPIGHDPRSELDSELAPRRAPRGVIRLWPGPHATWFEGGTRALTARPWTVTNDVSRVGVRLERGRFSRTADARDQMESLGLTEGAVQVTPAGEPIVMMANHPTTGGYPVIAVVDPDDLAVVAQSPPGTTLHFTQR
ncbi:MAG: biotin-dependent carboxyltransferase family protein [Ilumatobacteraceae bacterium]